MAPSSHVRLAPPVKNLWSFTPVPVYAVMRRCFTKDWRDITLYFDCFTSAVEMVVC